MEYLEVFLRYLFATVDDEKEPELKKRIQKSIGKGRKSMPTIAEKWIKQGIEQGIELGIEKGREEGREEGIEKTVINMIKAGMNNADIRKLSGLSLHKIEALRKKAPK